MCWAAGGAEVCAGEPAPGGFAAGDGSGGVFVGVVGGLSNEGIGGVVGVCR